MEHLAVYALASTVVFGLIALNPPEDPATAAGTSMAVFGALILIFLTNWPHAFLAVYLVASGTAHLVVALSTSDWHRATLNTALAVDAAILRTTIS
jgi:hypothetical protein